MTRTDQAFDAQLPKVLIAGGGVAGLEAMLALRALVGKQVGIEVIAPEPQFWYRPLAVAEPFGLGRSHHFALNELAVESHAVHDLDAVARVDHQRWTVHTRHGVELEYAALLIATGARPKVAVRGALTFRGPADTEAFARLLAETEAGAVRRLVFAIPAGPTWQLPMYELALLTDAWLMERGVRERTELTIVTPEDAPLDVFGPSAREALTSLLETRGIGLEPGRHPHSFVDGALTAYPGPSLEADRVVALPRLEGAAPDGLPTDRSGFVAVDDECRVRGVDGVYAAGDVTVMPLKQGGLAAQQADAAAAAIAADLGFDVERQPFRPILRGLLLTGAIPRYLRTDLAAGREDVSIDPLWWPPSKIVGRHLAPMLAARGRLSLDTPLGDAVPVEVELGG